MTTAFERGMEGSELAARKWTDLEVVMVDRVIRELGSRPEGTRFTTDDVWAELGPTFPVTKGIAGRLVAAVGKGWIRRTQETVISRRKGEHGHAQRLAVWESAGCAPPADRAPRGPVCVVCRKPFARTSPTVTPELVVGTCLDHGQMVVRQEDR